MRRIADALISLQQHGSGDYVGWEMWFPCNLPNVVDRLQQEARQLEADLEQWKHEIQEQRERFYELNYYSTKQLLLLREELGLLGDSGENEVKPEAMALLQSISRNITDTEVKTCMLSVSTRKDDGMCEDAEDNVVSTRESVVPNSTSPSSSAIVTDVLEVKSESNKCSTSQAQQKQDDLRAVKEAIVLDIENNFGYDKKLIWSAFDHCKNPRDQYAIEAWCSANQDEYPCGDDREEEEEEEERAKEEEKVEEPLLKGKPIEQEKSPYNKDIFKKDTTGILPGSDQQEMETIEKNVAVDMHHPVVKDLLKLNYSLKECFQAAQRYPNDSHAAHLYLMQNQERSDMFGAVDDSENDVVTSGQPDVEDHVENFVRYMHV